jgi:hypothetical protein
MLAPTNPLPYQQLLESVRVFHTGQERLRDAGGPVTRVALGPTWVVLSMRPVAPTSTSPRAATFRPEVQIAGRVTRDRRAHHPAVEPARLGNSAGRFPFDDLRGIGAALRRVHDVLAVAGRPMTALPGNPREEEKLKGRARIWLTHL